ncbi:MAG TPA: division/cell wall cluster transcriptional repressor MraZ, partial [Bacteroides sp.]|nr:division/cell wall cluster transcriptional repressor MraZ [Bacteroides sp.]
EVDKQGRILLPASLRELAGLTKDVVFVGMASHIEIWDRATYDDKMNLDDIDISRIADNLESMGLSL